MTMKVNDFVKSTEALKKKQHGMAFKEGVFNVAAALNKRGVDIHSFGLEKQKEM